MPAPRLSRSPIDRTVIGAQLVGEHRDQAGESEQKADEPARVMRSFSRKCPPTSTQNGMVLTSKVLRATVVCSSPT